MRVGIKLAGVALAWGLALAQAAAAPMGLLQAHRLAVEHDPRFGMAQHQRDIGQEYETLGRSALLPQISYNYSRGRNHSTIHQESARGITRTDRNYDNYASILSLDQPLFDMAAWSRYRLGQAQTAQSQAQFLADAQALSQRLLQAYLGALQARDALHLAKAQVRAYEGLLQQNWRLQELGEGTAADVLETRSRLETARADSMEADDALRLALRALEDLTGQPLTIAALPALRDDTPALPLEVHDLDGWLARMQADSPLLQVRRQALTAADHNAQARRAGHLPRVSLYATHRRTDSDSETTYGQNYNTASVGIRLQIPLYAGGGISASARQAASEQARVRRELEAVSQDNAQEIRRAWLRIASSGQLIAARQAALDSARAQLQATRRSVAGGERTNQDVLDAEQQQFSAWRNWLEARYGYLQAWLDLHVAAGVLQPAHLAQVDALLVPAKGD